MSDNPNYRTLSGFTGASVIDMQGQVEVATDAGALCQSGVGRAWGCGSVLLWEREVTVIYRTHNLTGCLVVLQSEASMRQFLRDRQRSVESKMRKAIKAGLRAGHPVADALIVEMCLILALQDELEGYTHGT